MKMEGTMYGACLSEDSYEKQIPYGRKFWRGIYFVGLAVLRAKTSQCDVIIIVKS